MRSSCSTLPSRRAKCKQRFHGPAMGFLSSHTAGSLVLAILQSWAASVSAQGQGFLSLNCGGTNTFTDKNGIVWVPDIPYIFTGSVSQVSASSATRGASEEPQILPGSRKKNCYILQVTPYGTYLLRATFLYGNYNTLGKPPALIFSSTGTTGLRFPFQTPTLECTMSSCWLPRPTISAYVLPRALPLTIHSSPH
ncbi:hypothetical protein O6H91_02G110200 [Diphasiastrum complanatum]|uniref:Uncharacterized protein n=1 Tax=Diphasiastrum complanatum TaxID=34168 RepID=A0ACC2EJC9_DIPCM|nr:hypothetical protein O6H91_02G110200 [Diphasiastrum complanatum]